MKILAIETSCDETACAIVEDGVHILSSVISSSSLMHAKYGGIVPEVAAREQLTCIIPTIEEALKQANTDYDAIDTIAVTIGPGLIGSLLVGVETAKTIALFTKKPLIPVNHVLAHMYANFIHPDKQDSSRISNNTDSVTFPALSLVVSGGHTELFLMKSPRELEWLGGTLDDAAGEAFDKTARLLGFENRGGPAIQEAALRSKVSLRETKNTITLPRPMMHDNTLNFSFSGLKTAILREWKKQENHDDAFIHGLAYEVQESITDVLVKKTIQAAQLHEVSSILISGGVAANLRLREKLSLSLNIINPSPSLHIPPIHLCTDNAVYIASYAYFRGTPVDWHTITAAPDLSVENV